MNIKSPKKLIEVAMPETCEKNKGKPGFDLVHYSLGNFSSNHGHHCSNSTLDGLK